ncbi:MAG TPA: L,D-transpeptidase, partial [Chloroflexota bacterium]|nr:L,D-transpeptidase [Chloroflexota bacterium]
WAGPDAGGRSLWAIPQFRRFMVVEPQSGSRLKVWSPEKDVVGYIDARLVGPSGESVWLEEHPTKPVRPIGLPGRSIGEKTYVRALPVYDEETEVRKAPNNTGLFIKESVVTSDGTEWYVVGDGGEYIRASEVRLPRPLAAAPLVGKWIDADLSEPTMVTAYEGGKVVYSGLAIRGVNGTPTPEGTFQILRRTADETMDSETIGIPRDSPKGYLLKNVLYTQYFTGDGASFHYNYWLGTFGYAGSHGCLGLNLEDSKWLWDWADIGTSVVIRSTGGNPESWGIAASAAAASDGQATSLGVTSRP